jgi:acetyl-CoA carboxylase carboxyltransferase component
MSSDVESDLSTTAGKLADLKRRVAEVAHAGSERAVEKQHARGKKTARERLEMLLDPGSGVPPTFRIADPIRSGPKWRIINAREASEIHSGVQV